MVIINQLGMYVQDLGASQRIQLGGLSYQLPVISRSPAYGRRPVSGLPAAFPLTAAVTNLVLPCGTLLDQRSHIQDQFL